jgi:hypothetical protein
MDISPKDVGALRDVITASVDVDSLGMLDAQVSAFLHALAWYMGGSQAAVDGFVVDKADRDAGTLTVYWIVGSALGSLTVSRPSEGSSAAPPISGWLRSLSMMVKLDLSADVRIDRTTKEMDVRPGATIHFRDEESPIEIATHGLTDQRARRVADFIAHLQYVMAERDNQKVK